MQNHLFAIYCNVQASPAVLKVIVPLAAITQPGLSTVGAGTRGFITDANNVTFGSQVDGGGANSIPVYSDGTNWYVG